MLTNYRFIYTAWQQKQKIQKLHPLRKLLFSKKNNSLWREILVHYYTLSRFLHFVCVSFHTLSQSFLFYVVTIFPFRFHQNLIRFFFPSLIFFYCLSSFFLKLVTIWSLSLLTTRKAEGPLLLFPPLSTPIVLPLLAMMPFLTSRYFFYFGNPRFRHLSGQCCQKCPVPELKFRSKSYFRDSVMFNEIVWRFFQNFRFVSKNFIFEQTNLFRVYLFLKVVFVVQTCCIGEKTERAYFNTWKVKIWSIPILSTTD